MLDHFRTLTRGVTTAAIVLAARGLDAQSPASSQPDPRWTSWLGCWAVDGSRDDQRSSSPTSVTCFVPVAGSRAVDALTISRGAVVSRDRLDAGARPHPIDGNGCRGTETVNWSANGRRVYVRAEYTCTGGTPGNSTALFAITSQGEWLRIEKVRAGGGATVTATRLRPTGLSGALTSSSAREIESQQRAIATARAAAATVISADEILDAVNNLDGDVVRSWLVASDQIFDFDVQQIAALSNAGVPAPILQIVSGVQIDASVRAVVYPLAPTTIVEQAPPVMTTMRACPPEGCYAPSRYSAYNGPDYAQNGFAPPFGPGYSFPYPYPYSPLGFTGFGGLGGFSTVNVGSPFNKRGRGFDGRDHRRQGHNNWQSGGKGSGGRGPVGRGPAGRGR